MSERARFLWGFRVSNVGGGPCLECEWGVDDGGSAGSAYWPRETTEEWLHDEFELRRRVLKLLDEIEWCVVA